MNALDWNVRLFLFGKWAYRWTMRCLSRKEVRIHNIVGINRIHTVIRKPIGDPSE